MNAWARYWFGPVAATRPYLLMRVVYAVLALDLWIVQVPRGGRYGIDGFNVAHFGWLEAVQPLPTAALYVGLQLSLGLLALVCALADPGRWARGLLAALHTYGWAMSLHDAYQHHYFLSLVLTLFVFFPRLRSRDLVAPGAAGGASVSAWAYALLGANVAVLYAFAGFAKLDPAWRAGDVLRQIQYRGEVAKLEAWLGGLGVSSDLFWSAMSLSVVAVEWALAAAYLVAPRRDAANRRWVALLAWLGFALGVGLHASAEVVMRLRIGWFSYYMLAFACVYFLPGTALAGLGRAALRLTAWRDRLRSPVEAAGLGRAVVPGAVLIVLVVGLALDLPGSQGAAVAAAGVLIASLLVFRLAGRGLPGVGYGAATAAAALAMWAAAAVSSSRFDYYMMTGRSLDRLGQRTAALDAVDRAKRYGSVSLEGTWRTGDSTVKLSVRGAVATAVFVKVGEEARRLGFSPGDVSFVAAVSGPHLHGEQTLRYRNQCHPAGRKVPMIGRLGLGGNLLTTHCYSLDVDAACQDTGAYSLIDNAWSRESS